jgi:hypothetical protein
VKSERRMKTTRQAEEIEGINALRQTSVCVFEGLKEVTMATW